MSLKESGLAWRARRTQLYKAWRRIREPEQALAKDREQAFYRALLGDLHGLTVLDVGANVGAKSEIFRSFGARVVVVEADPDLGGYLSRRFAGDRNIIVERAAVSSEAGFLELFKFAGAEAFNTASPEWAQYMQAPSNRFDAVPTPVRIRVPAITLASLIERHGPVHFLKVDVEGFEWIALSTLLVPIPCISLEFNLPVFRAELGRCVEHLRQLDPSYRFNVAITEPPLRFELDTWLEADALIAVLDERKWGYAEVYARRSALAQHRNG